MPSPCSLTVTWSQGELGELMLTCLMSPWMQRPPSTSRCEGIGMDGIQGTAKSRPAALLAPIRVWPGVTKGSGSREPLHTWKAGSGVWESKWEGSSNSFNLGCTKESSLLCECLWV